MAKVKDLGDGRYSFYCPGCRHLHVYPTIGTEPIWSFNGDLNNPTFKPSLLNRWGKYADPNWTLDTPENTAKFSGICHLYVTDGTIQFLTDCTHDHAGRTVTMADVETSPQ